MDHSAKAVSEDELVEEVTSITSYESVAKLVPEAILKASRLFFRFFESMK